MYPLFCLRSIELPKNKPFFATKSFRFYEKSS